MYLCGMFRAWRIVWMCIFFSKNLQNVARELAMEQELEDMIQDNVELNMEFKNKDGLNGYNKQEQLQMLEEARDNLINIQNAHLGNIK